MNGFLASLKRRLPLGRFGWNVATLAGGTALGQALVVVVSPLLTRLYSPTDFGGLAVYTSLLSIAVTLASLRYELAIPLPEKDSTAANLLALSLVIVCAMSLLVGGAVLLFGDQIVAWTNAAHIGPYLWLLALGMLGAGTYQALNYWAVRKEYFARIARTKLNQAIALVVTQIGVGVLVSGPLGLLAGDVLGRASGSATLATQALRKDREALKSIRPSEMRQAGQRYRRFPLLSSGSGLLNSAGIQLPPLLFAAFYGPQVAGWLALGHRVMTVPITLIGQSVAQVYYGEASRLTQEDPAALYRMFWQTAKRLFMVGVIPVVAIGLGGSWLFSLIFGSPWRMSGLFVQILALQYLAQFVVLPLSKTLTILERQDLQLAWDAGRLLLVVGSLVVSRALAAPEWTAVAAYGAAMFAAYCGLLALSSKSLSKRVRDAPA